MDEKQETIADIVAEMRIFKCRNLETGELEECNAIAKYFADRIEAAHKREVDNGAKMREALKQILALAKAKGLFEIQSLSETALAEPLRNCDKFGTDNMEVSLAYEEFCDRAEIEENINGAIVWLLSLDAD